MSPRQIYFLAHIWTAVIKDHLVTLLLSLSSYSSVLFSIVSDSLLSDASMSQLMLDFSTLPSIIWEVQLDGDDSLRILLHLTRNFCHGHHVERQRQLLLKMQ